MSFKVAVVGATGNVGREMLDILAERAFPVGEVVALASSRSRSALVRPCRVRLVSAALACRSRSARFLNLFRLTMSAMTRSRHLKNRRRGMISMSRRSNQCVRWFCRRGEKSWFMRQQEFTKISHFGEALILLSSMPHCSDGSEFWLSLSMI